MANVVARFLYQNQLASLHERVSGIEQLLASLFEGGGLSLPGLPPNVDPGPEDFARLPGGLGGVIRRPPIADPATIDLARLRELALLPEFAELRVADLLRRLRPHPGGDPPSVDISRLTAAELEQRLHGIAAEKVRLESQEHALRKRLDDLKKGAG